MFHFKSRAESLRQLKILLITYPKNTKAGKSFFPDIAKLTNYWASYQYVWSVVSHLPKFMETLSTPQATRFVNHISLFL